MRDKLYSLDITDVITLYEIDNQQRPRKGIEDLQEALWEKIDCESICIYAKLKIHFVY